MPSASIRPAACSVHTRRPPRDPAGSGVRPNPAWSGATTRHAGLNAAAVADHAPEPVVPGPDPCSRSTAGPSPASSTRTGEPATSTVLFVAPGARGPRSGNRADRLVEDLHHHAAELRHVRPASARHEVAV